MTNNDKLDENEKKMTEMTKWKNDKMEKDIMEKMTKWQNDKKRQNDKK